MTIGFLPYLGDIKKSRFLLIMIFPSMSPGLLRGTGLPSNCMSNGGHTAADRKWVENTFGPRPGHKVTTWPRTSYSRELPV